MNSDNWALKMMGKANNKPIDDFEGLSPIEYDNNIFVKKTNILDAIFDAPKFKKE